MISQETVLVAGADIVRLHLQESDQTSLQRLIVHFSGQLSSTLKPVEMMGILVKFWVYGYI